MPTVFITFGIAKPPRLIKLPANLMAIPEDLAVLVRQERELQFLHFNEETAWQIGTRLRDWAHARRLAVVIDLHRFGQPLFYYALAGTSPDNVNWVRRKRNVVAHFHRSSYRVGLELEQRRSNLLERYGLPAADYAAHGGSFPLSVTGAGIIGAVTVSGLAQRFDHEFVVEALCAHLGKTYTDLALALTPAV